MRNGKLVCYLAGAVDDPGWRKDVIRSCRGAEYLSPMDDVGAVYSNAFQMTQASMEHPTFHLMDKIKIEQADVVFAYFQSGSDSVFSGTSFECGVAVALGKPVIVVNDMENAYLYEMVQRFASVYCPTLDNGIYFLRSMIREASHRAGRGKCR